MEAHTRTEIGAVHVDPVTTRSHDSSYPQHGTFHKRILVNVILRSVAILLTFIAAIVLGVAKETMDTGIIKSVQFAAYV